MNEYYENRTKSLLPWRTYTITITIIRINGKTFHTYTKELQQPFDNKLINDMDETAKYLCENIQDAKFDFVQSDEISILLTDFDKLQTSNWFDGNIQKITSISASLATAKFNELIPNKIDLFDSRVFTIPNNIEVENYFIWWQQNIVKNNISSVAQNLYSSKELNKVNVSEMQKLCFQKKVNWNDFEPKKKQGRLIVKKYYNKKSNEKSRWISIDPPIFTTEKEKLSKLIPLLNGTEQH